MKGGRGGEGEEVLVILASCDNFVALNFTFIDLRGYH
jgi:hypothetical protein